jgi:hypothetical protein
MTDTDAFARCASATSHVPVVGRGRSPSAPIVAIPYIEVVRLFRSFIRQDRVGLVDQLEFLRLLRVVFVHVGMQAEGEPPVGNLDLLERRRVGNSEHAIEIF